MTRTADAKSSRAGDLARLVQTTLGLPLARVPSTELEPAHRSLTIREQSLFRAATRRALRAATGLAGITLAALTPFIASGMALALPERQFALFAIFGIEGVIGLGAAVLTYRRRRVPPLALAFALALSPIVTTGGLLVFVPEIRTPSMMLLALLPPAVALFLPWGVPVQAGWLLAGAPALAVFTVASAGRGIPAPDWLGGWLVLTVSGIASLLGSFGNSSVRRRAFGLQMEARRVHVLMAAREAQLERLNGELARVTRTDPLTGLGNRRRLDEELTAAAARATRYGNDCAIALLDLDGFKAYNDSLGHVAGDAALRAVAAALAASVRATDIACRFGGDEFVILMPEQSLEGAVSAAERIRRAIEELRLHYPTPTGPQVLTISAGIALLGRGAAHDEDEVLRAADAALYRAKQAGHTRVEASPLSPHRTIAVEGSKPA